jgi:hypothetical protein
VSDRRALRAKLRTMAERGTEHEREIARRKLDAMGPEPQPQPFAHTFTPGAQFDGGGMRVRVRTRVFYGRNGETFTVNWGGASNGVNDPFPE